MQGKLMTLRSSLHAALKAKCGRCGEGDLYNSYLKLKTECDQCGQDYAVADTADGPAFFVGFGLMILLAPFYFILPIADIPFEGKVVGYAVVLAATAGLTYLLLPIAKSILFNLQLHHRAEEAKFE